MTKLALFTHNFWTLPFYRLLFSYSQDKFLDVDTWNGFISGTVHMNILFPGLRHLPSPVLPPHYSHPALRLCIFSWSASLFLASLLPSKPGPLGDYLNCLLPSLSISSHVLAHLQPCLGQCSSLHPLSYRGPRTLSQQLHSHACDRHCRGVPLQLGQPATPALSLFTSPPVTSFSFSTTALPKFTTLKSPLTWPTLHSPCSKQMIFLLILGEQSVALGLIFCNFHSTSISPCRDFFVVSNSLLLWTIPG